VIVENINKIGISPRILVVPLDWGLGHATRCIPIINALYKWGAEVLVAGEGANVKILEKTHPNTVILPLKGYRVRYSRHEGLFMLKMALQVPKIISAIKQENNWLKDVIKQYRIDAVISDNRFGLYNQQIPAVFITHQLYIDTGTEWFDRLAQKINYFFINKFSACWVPDIKGHGNIAGELSHPKKLPQIPVKYIGIISRFKVSRIENKDGLLILLSGPEPQRTLFEKRLLQQIKNHPGVVTLVRGLPLKNGKAVISNDKLVVYDHLAAEELGELIGRSKHIIARCGYSTIMDLLALGQKAILVPTPGQTEQQYLAKHLLENKLFFTCKQQGFDLDKAIASAEKFNFVSPEPLVGLDESVIRDWVSKIASQVNPSQ